MNKANETDSTEYFGSEITRKIALSLPINILIYVGSAAEFSLHPENDWIVYTGRLFENPQLRFIETNQHSLKIYTLDKIHAKQYAEFIRKVHTKVEQNRNDNEGNNKKMSNKAFNLVADMLIDYGIKGYEYLYNVNLTNQQKEEYFNDIKTFQEWMGVEVPDKSYKEFLTRRDKSIENDLNVNKNTNLFFEAYRRDLGFLRYYLLKQFQAHFIEPKLARKLNLKRNPLFSIDYYLYPLFNNRFVNHFLIKMLTKKEVFAKILEMEHIMDKYKDV